ncbi:hypothetical protein MKW94_028481 [Papaver nudicaule]|uniref:Uncharacterized protein n=1 Tax=Papaver nudicaule TaxID=74823 RepID=A0AA41RNG6_PAPNU|nr:hypothetical protein [Papaver nudicaule]
MEENKVFIFRRRPRIQELIESSTEHDRVPPRRSPRIAEQARIREKMDMRNERKRQRRHEMDPKISSSSAAFLREPNKAQ